jgi:hypothetical protein
MKRDYEAPTVVVLGSVTDLTLLNTGGPNPDLQLNLTSLP